MNTEIHARNANLGTGLYARTMTYEGLDTERQNHAVYTVDVIELKREMGLKDIEAKDADFNSIVNGLDAIKEEYGAEYITVKVRRDYKTITISIKDNDYEEGD